jgi:hypothetical protein
MKAKSFLSTGFVKVCVVLSAVSLFCGSQCIGEGRLGELVEGSGLGWLAGKWVSTSDAGYELELVYKWDLEKNVITTEFKVSEYTYRSMIYYSISRGEVVEIGIDTLGNVTERTWEEMGGKAVSNGESTDTYGQRQGMRVTHERVDEDTIKVELYEVDSGEVAYSPQTSVEFKRWKKPVEKKKAEEVKEKEKK